MCRRGLPGGWSAASLWASSTSCRVRLSSSPSPCFYADIISGKIITRAKRHQIYLGEASLRPGTCLRTPMSFLRQRFRVGTAVAVSVSMDSGTGSTTVPSSVAVAVRDSDCRTDFSVTLKSLVGLVSCAMSWGNTILVKRFRVWSIQVVDGEYEYNLSFYSHRLDGTRTLVWPQFRVATSDHQLLGWNSQHFFVVLCN